MAENVSREQIRQASNFFVHFRLTFQVDIYFHLVILWTAF